MNLLQEYYLRNNVCSPFILHSNSHLLLHRPDKKKSNDRYRICEIRAFNEVGNDGANVGKFEICFLSPMKYLTFSNSCLTKEHTWITYWDDFEKLILSKAYDWKYKEGWLPVSEQHEMKVCSWELLSFACDARFSELPMGFLDFNYSIFDNNISLPERASLVDNAALGIEFYSDKNHACRMIMESWSYVFGLMISPKYAYWLSKLIKDI